VDRANVEKLFASVSLRYEVFGFRLGMLSYLVKAELPKTRSGSDPIYRHYCEIFGKNNIDLFLKGVGKYLREGDAFGKVLERNQALIQTMKLLKCSDTINRCQRKMVISGAGHVFDFDDTIRDNTKLKKEQKRSLIFSQMNRWDQNAPWAELREFLKEEKHAILYPVKR